jgi:hypothetical protein
VSGFCMRCDGEGRILVMHSDYEPVPAGLEFSRLRVERTPYCPPQMIYDMACPECSDLWTPRWESIRDGLRRLEGPAG